MRTTVNNIVSWWRGHCASLRAWLAAPSLVGLTRGRGVRTLAAIVAVKTLVKVAVVMWLFSSCNNDSCQSNSTSLPLAGFYSSADGRKVSVDSLTIYGIGAPGDSAIVRCGRAVQQAYLPLRTTVSTTQYVLQYEALGIPKPEYNDTITLTYDKRPYFEDSQCGALYVFDITSHSCTHHFVDSLVVRSSHITNLDVETLQIYFRTEGGDQQ